ncbi:DNA-binding transcriptional regulator, FrmR family [Clostridium cavendishii DSM 21758]|uniref:DNA-binding transcriptional regulator, FrmR family n=1 Tax=Clostridium cavendishii DSM 21758 TaxID=1121302 RepID=A0A1M6A9T2_9CLOT|nr:metal-sensitive transcriptional regulator [Clostridium cavendishii]SHI33209.1 DNA-binding transcriptional regulator, FrmR family [Clostridium cavendishii DSM 21758]
MDDKEELLKRDIIVRLRRIEGQVKGIQGMMDKNVCCPDVLVQIAAIRAAINKVGVLIVENYARNCIGIEEGSESEEGLEQLIKTLNTFMK